MIEYRPPAPRPGDKPIVTRAKLVDELLLNSTTLQDDNDMIDIVIGAGALYRFDGHLEFDTVAGGPSGIKLMLVVDAGTVDTWWWRASAIDGLSAIEARYNLGSIGSTQIALPAFTVVDVEKFVSIKIDGIIWGNAGVNSNLKLQWASNAAGTGNLVHRAGSWMSAQRLSN